MSWAKTQFASTNSPAYEVSASPLNVLVPHMPSWLSCIINYRATLLLTPLPTEMSINTHTGNIPSDLSGVELIWDENLLHERLYQGLIEAVEDVSVLNFNKC